MSFFSRKRQTSHTPAVVPAPQITPGSQRAEIPGPSEALKLQQQQQREKEQARLAREEARAAAQQSQSTPADLARAPSSGSPSSGSPQQPRPQVYPWSARQLQLNPPLIIPRPGMAQPTTPSPSPFPRYGHSLPPVASGSGELYIFGGLVRDSVRNDLYSFSTANATASLIQTFGDVPLPRVGHASAIVSSVLIIWGGDTKTNEDDKQDNALYLLNLGTREWTRVLSQGLAPAGRYGHAVAMCGTKFFLYGGQVDGEFLDDLWAFDLGSLKRGQPIWENLTAKAGIHAPARRTGHIMVTYGDKLYLFGGTDGQYHYNDTWCYDTSTGTWSDLTCIGFIPLPREGHAAALVDDVMYVFGGRGVDGKDLGDLAAFKISNQRWYMFQNMGPGPSGRSGHAMASAGPRVFVLGGESSTVPNPDDPNFVHVLDTKHIRYPDSSQRPSTANGQNGRKSVTSPSGQSQQNGPQRATSPQQSTASAEDIRRNLAASPTQATRQQNGIISQSQSVQPFPTSSQGPGPANGTRIRSPVQAYPTRPRREDDIDSGLPDPSDEDAVGGSSRDGQRSREGALSPDQSALSKSKSARSPTPTNTAIRAVSPANVPQTTSSSLPGLSNRLAARSPSPVVSTPPPADAFHYGSSRGSMHPTSRSGNHSSNGSIDGSVNANAARELRSKDSEIEMLRRREAWMRSALTKAASQGFVWPDSDITESLGPSTPVNEDIDRQSVIDMVFALKKEHANIHNELALRAQELSEKFAEAERIKSYAVQEAAFSRAKLTAYESRSLGDLSSLDKERSLNLERQLSGAQNDRQALQRQVNDLTEALQTQIQLKEQVDEQRNTSTQRADNLERLYSELVRTHSELQRKHDTVSGSLRDHSSRLTSLSSLTQQHEAERSGSQSQIATLTESRDQHIRALEQMKVALAAAASRGEEVDGQLRQARERIAQLEADQDELRNEVRSKSHEAEVASARLLETEDAWAKTREEADALRALTTGSLGQLLDFHRDMKADEERAIQPYLDKIAALEQEASKLRRLFKEFEQKNTESQEEIEEDRRKHREATTEHLALLSQLAGVRSQLADQIARSGEIQKALAERDDQLSEASRAVAAVELQLATLRNYLAENRITVDIEELLVGRARNQPVLSAFQLRNLEDQLEDKSRRLEDSERALRAAEAGRRIAEDRLQEISGGSSRSQSPLASAIARAEAAEKQLAEAEQAHKERLQQMEADYQTAVHYVNKTEKMCRKLREEQTRQKALNESLQSELDTLRPSSEASSRTRVVNGRITPLSDEGHENSLKSQLAEAHRRIQRATAENTELHKKVASLQSDMEHLRESAATANRDAVLRAQQIEDLESEVDRLQAALDVVQQGRSETVAEQLHNANAALKRDNELLQQRIGLLLDVDQPGISRGGEIQESGGPESHSTPENVDAFDALSSELDDWLASSSNSRRLSHYEPTSHPHSLSQLQRNKSPR